ncbi:MAG: hypothetical protein KGL39_34350 [Patescibacteria group bacterium]|nr:hypothetical protein [Patescibacteria group bacterium]
MAQIGTEHPAIQVNPKEWPVPSVLPMPSLPAPAVTPASPIKEPVPA